VSWMNLLFETSDLGENLTMTCDIIPDPENDKLHKFNR
jgi:hypothetical protein